MNKAWHQYLSRFTEPEVNALAGLEVQRKRYCLVIPACRESGQFIQRLCSGLLKSESALLILVINQPASAPQPFQQNRELWHHAQSLIEDPRRRDNLIYGELPGTGSGILLVDRFSNHPIPDKQGVGLARKIGNDLALQLIIRELVETRILFNTDADAHLPTNYFSAIPPSLNGDEPSAWVYPFRHRCNNDVPGIATELYEQYLSHYVQGLTKAGSPYAYHSLGSILAIDADRYAAVRGFPRRAAGEDFYLLNKLAKLAPIKSLSLPTIELDARESDRVPFGTGPSVQRLLASNDKGGNRIFYHPDVFTTLGEVLRQFDSQPRGLDDLRLSGQAFAALGELRIDEFFRHVERQQLRGDQYQRQFHAWFDAFRTLKFIHWLRDHYYPNLSHPQLCNQARMAVSACG